MKYRIYYPNGTTTDEYPQNEDNFFISEMLNVDFLPSRYYYPGDQLMYTLDESCVNLYDLFQNRLFSSPDEYYKDISIQPQGLTRAGLDSDFDLPKENFEKYFSESLANLYSGINSEENSLLLKKLNEMDAKKYKYAYLADCQSLINTLQELILNANSCFLGFYKLLADLPIKYDFENDYFTNSFESRLVFSTASSLIISLYSIFDILTKICYELEHIKDCSGSYPKLACSNILFGSRKELKNISFEGTIFEKSRNLSIIKNLRNELVHNATWEMNPKIFIKINDGKLIDKCIYLPDFNEDGNFITYKSRKRFFASGTKLNEELPTIYLSTLQKIYITIEKINNTYSKI